MKILVEMTKEEYYKCCCLAVDLALQGYDSLQKRIYEGTIVEDEEEKKDENV